MSFQCTRGFDRRSYIYIYMHFFGELKDELGWHHLHLRKFSSSLTGRWMISTKLAMVVWPEKNKAVTLQDKPSRLWVSSLFPLWVVLFGVEIFGQTTGFHGFFVSHRRFPVAKISRTNVISILKRHGIIFVAVLLFSNQLSCSFPCFPIKTYKKDT